MNKIIMKNLLEKELNIFCVTRNHTKTSSVGRLRCQNDILDLYPSSFNLIILSSKVNKKWNCLRSSAMHKPRYKYSSFSWKIFVLKQICHRAKTKYWCWLADPSVPPAFRSGWGHVREWVGVRCDRPQCHEAVSFRNCLSIDWVII